MGIQVAFDSQKYLPNTRPVDLYDPANPGRVVPILRAGYYDQGYQDNDVGSIRLEVGTVVWTVGMDETEKAGVTPLEDWWLRDSKDGLEYVVSKVDRSDTLRFFRLTTSVRPDRRVT